MINVANILSQLISCLLTVFVLIWQSSRSPYLEVQDVWGLQTLGDGLTDFLKGLQHPSRCPEGPVTWQSHELPLPCEPYCPGPNRTTSARQPSGALHWRLLSFLLILFFHRKTESATQPPAVYFRLCRQCEFWYEHISGLLYSSQMTSDSTWKGGDRLFFGRNPNTDTFLASPMLLTIPPVSWAHLSVRGLGRDCQDEAQLWVN